MGHRLAAWIGTLPSDHQYRARIAEIAELYAGLDKFEMILADLMTCPPGSPAASLGNATLIRAVLENMGWI